MAMSSSLMLCCFYLLMAMAGATQFKVGGSNGWSMPPPNAISYNQWAERNRFQIGDSILFVYTPGEDSVLEVDKQAYADCDTTTYINKFDDGNTIFTFNRSGPYYFISGVQANCLKNESLNVVVLSDRSNRAAAGPSQSALPPSTPLPPPPSPTEGAAPASPPAERESIPPPAPAASYSPPPPPNSPKSAPASPPAGAEAKPPTPSSSNAASTKVLCFLGLTGALLGSILSGL